MKNNPYAEWVHEDYHRFLAGVIDISTIQRVKYLTVIILRIKKVKILQSANQPFGI